MNAYSAFVSGIQAIDAITSALHTVGKVKEIDLDKDGTPDILELKEKAEQWMQQCSALVAGAVSIVELGKKVFGELRQEISQ